MNAMAASENRPSGALERPPGPGAATQNEAGVAAPPTGSPRLRLLVLIDDLGAASPDRLWLDAAPGLQKHDCDVIIASPGRWGPLADALQERGLRAVAFGGRHGFDPPLVGRMLSLLRRERIHVVHAQAWLSNLLARTVGRLADAPVVITTHHPASLARRPLRALLDRLTAGLADALVAPTEPARRDALRRTGLRPGRVLALPRGIALPLPLSAAGREAARLALGAAPGESLIGCATRAADPGGGLEIVLQAAGLLANDRPDVRFVVIGSSRSRTRIEELAARAGVGHRTVIGAARLDGAASLAALDLLVDPAIEERPDPDVLEAMAAGVPVIATRVGARAEEVLDGETGSLVPPRDAGALARACAALLGDPGRLRRSGAAGRQRAAERFSFDAAVARSAGLYRELLRQRRSGSDEGAPLPWEMA